jgi:hypothetical protein
VQIATVEPRPTAVVAQTTTWEEFPRLWAPMLDEVYGVVRPQSPPRRWQNVMLYRDGRPSVEVGVLDPGPFEPAGRVVASQLPGGKVATALHRGDYAQINRTHEALLADLAAQGLEPTGVRWEIYGHAEDPEVEIYWLLDGR